MKKGLLTLSAALLATAGVYAAGGSLVSGEANTYWKATEYPEWNDVAPKYLASFYTKDQGFTEDSAISSVYLTDILTDANKAEWESKWDGNGRYGVKVENNELVVNFTPSKDGWANIQYAQGGFRAKDGAIKTPAESDTAADGISNDTLAKYFFVGKSIDITEAKIISGKVFVPQTFKDDAKSKPGFVIRVSVVDVHGHEWNADGDPTDTIPSDEWNMWTSFKIDYDEITEEYGALKLSPGDGYGEMWHNMKRPFATKTVKAPIDFANITGVRMYLEPGEVYSGTDVFEVKIKDLVIGDPGTVSVNEEKTTSEVAYTQEGRTFNAEGAVKLVNLGNGIEVAAVNGSVTAPAAGAYALVTETGSVKVAVK